MNAGEYSVSTLRAMTDNYVHIIHNDSSAIVVDPTIAAPVIEFLHEKQLNLTHILLTHHHTDHIGGCAELKTNTDCTIIGPKDKRIPLVDQHDTLQLELKAELLSTPGHTSTHVCFYFPDLAAAFTGDTLFLGGCGRLFEGTAVQMWQSLMKLRALPRLTSIYPGHDYTLDNLEFCHSVLPSDPDIMERIMGIKATESPSHATIDTEIQTNVFLMCDNPHFTNQTGIRGFPADIFAELRRTKDSW